MHRALKSDNKLCYARDVEHRQRIHRQKLATMRPTSKSNSKAALDNNAPQRHKHLELKLKKRQLDDEQYTKIERENRILMEKMYAIMKAQKDPGSMEFRPGMRINKSQGPMVDCFLSETSVFPGQAVRQDSLNRESRRRDYMRIMEENMSILKRIQDRKPNYQRSNWEKERGAVEGYLKNIRNDTTTGYLSRSNSSRLPLSPMSSRSGSSSRKRLHRLPPMEGSDSRRGLRTAPSPNAGSREMLPMHEQEQDLRMGGINPLPPAPAARVTLTAPGPAPAPVGTGGLGQESYRVTAGGEVERTGVAAGSGAAQSLSASASASSSPLFKKGYKIGGGHYLVQFFSDCGPDGSKALRIRGIQIGERAHAEGEIMEWRFSEERLLQMFGSAEPWRAGGDASAFFNGFLVQLKEEDAVRIAA